MSVAPPFRLNIKSDTTPMSGADLSLYERIIEGKGALGVTEIRAVGNSGSEMLLYALLSRGIGVFPSNERVVEVKRLLQGALEDADREGAIWTPLLDRFARGPYLWEGRRNDRHAASLPEELREIPGSEDRIEAFIPWIEEQSDARSLVPLLRFKFSSLHRLVARHAKGLEALWQDGEALSDLSLDELAALMEQGDALEMNRHLSSDSLRVLARYSLERWEERETKHLGDTVSRSAAAKRDVKVLISAARKGALDEEMRERLFDFAKGEELRFAAHFDILVADPDCPEKILRGIVNAGKRRMPDYERPSLLVAVFFHPNSSDSLKTKIAESEEGQAALAKYADTASPLSTPKEKIALMLAFFGDNEDIVSELVHMKQADADIWREVVKKPNRTRAVLQPLADNKEARAVPEVRSSLREARSKFVLAPLLQDAGASEYAEIFERLAGMDARLAKTSLLQSPPPSGTRLNPEILAGMLQTGSQSERLELIRTLGSIAQSPEQKISPAAEGPKKARFR